MKRIYYLLVALFFLSASHAQDVKNADSDETALADGLCKDRKPAIEKGDYSVWTFPSKPEDTIVRPFVKKEVLIKAIVKSGTQPEPGTFKKVITSFYYKRNKLYHARYSEIVGQGSQVKTKIKDFFFDANGVQTFPAGTAPSDEDKFVSDANTEILKLYSGYVNRK